MYFEVYSLDFCPYCKKVIDTLDKYNLKSTIINVNEDNKHYYKDKLKKKTFPQVFLVTDNKSRYLGGSEKFMKLIKKMKKNGKLKQK
jgi:glutaredoxin